MRQGKIGQVSEAQYISLILGFVATIATVLVACSSTTRD